MSTHPPGGVDICQLVLPELLLEISTKTVLYQQSLHHLNDSLLKYDIIFLAILAYKCHQNLAAIFLINHLCPMDHDGHYYTRAVANTDLSVPRPNFNVQDKF